MCKKYDFDIQKFKKGQVWFCAEESTVTDALRNANHKALNGSRPWFIVSVNGSMISCVPLTTNITGNDTRHTDICFYNPLGDTDSRIVVSQIATKGQNEFTKYLYTFSEKDTKTIIDIIKQALFMDDTVISTATESNTPVKPEIEDIKEPQQELPAKSAPVVNVDEIYGQLEERLKKGIHPGQSIFKTSQEAALWLNRWEHEKTYVIASHFGISTSQVYSWKYAAKRKVKNR